MRLLGQLMVGLLEQPRTHHALLAYGLHKDDATQGAGLADRELHKGMEAAEAATMGIAAATRRKEANDSGGRSEKAGMH